jgi:hypothetical protein
LPNLVTLLMKGNEGINSVGTSLGKTFSRYLSQQEKIWHQTLLWRVEFILSIFCVMLVSRQGDQIGRIFTLYSFWKTTEVIFNFEILFFHGTSYVHISFDKKSAGLYFWRLFLELILSHCQWTFTALRCYKIILGPIK